MTLNVAKTEVEGTNVCERATVLDRLTAVLLLLAGLVVLAVGRRR